MHLFQGFVVLYLKSWQMDVALFFLAIIWGFNNPIIKSALDHFLPLSFNGLCVLLAAVTLFAFFKIQKRSVPDFGKDWPQVVLVGFLGTALYQIIFIFGIERTLAGNTSLILAMVPIFAAMIVHRLGHENVTLKMWVGIILGFIGVFFIVWGSNRGISLSRGTLFGDLTILLAALVGAASVVVCTPLVKRHPPFETGIVTLCVGSIFMTIASIPTWLKQDWSSITTSDWMALLYAAFLGTAMAQYIFYSGMRRKGTTRTTIYNNIVPVVSLLAAWLIVHEIPMPTQIAGCGLIIAGTLLTDL